MASEKTKSELRHSARKARRLLNADNRDLASQEICERASDDSTFKEAKLIGCYLASDEEVNCHPLIKCAWLMKKRVFVPTVRKNFKMTFVEFNSDSETRRNKYGLLEPVSGVKIEPEKLDVVFTPLVAFDLDLNRIGMGGGYYDRTFSFLRNEMNQQKPKLVGCAFDCQRVDNIVSSPWDIPLFQVITESRLVK